MEGQSVTLGTILKGYSERITKALKENLEKHDSLASKSLWQSVRVPVNIFGDTYVLQIIMEDYWKWVDQGRKPGKMPPIAPIAKWIAQKGLPIRAQVKASPLKRKSKLSLSERVRSRQRSVAFLIARSIGKKGIKPTHFYSDVINDKFIEDMKTDISKALKKDFTVQIIKSINN